jgi:hypothetical protein
MAFTVSPGVVTREIDLTTIVPENSTTAGAISGSFKWGPIEDIMTAVSEQNMVEQFQKPVTDNADYFFTAANYLAYSQNLKVVRVANTSAMNATTDSANAVLIKNSEAYHQTFDPDQGGTANVNYGAFVAKYAGSIGNSLKVSMCGADKTGGALTGTITYTQSNGTIVGAASDFGAEVSVGDMLTINSQNVLVTGVGNSIQLTVSDDGATDVAAGNTATRLIRSAFAESNMLGKLTIASGGTSVTGANTLFDLQLNVGDGLVVGGQTVKVKAITSNTALTLTSGITNAVSSNTFTRRWEYHGSFDSAPTTTFHGTEKNVTGDEVHVVIVDEDAEFSSVKGNVLEKFEGFSVADGAKGEDGSIIYYPTAINRRSKYLWWLKHPSGSSADAAINTLAWGTTADGTERSYNTNSVVYTASSTGGVDGHTLTDGQLITGYDFYLNGDKADIALIMTANASSVVTTHCIQNIAETRKDCVVLSSPARTDVVFNSGSEATAVVTARNALPSSSYAMLDSAWKYQYDRYNDVFRYVPMNGDVGGLIARATEDRDFFFSPAGFDRGQIKNVVKLSYNPSKADRDTLYKSGVNPCVTFPGQGTILFGDKTLLSRPSAFDRINIRRLFIVLEKAISQFAESSLFEFNDTFTRARFTSSVEPFLRDIQGRGGITDFAVVCDDSNNTPEVIDRNEFIGSIFVKPVRAINFILLNFVAVRSGVEFEEVINAG